MEKSTLSEGIFCHLRTDDKRFYYMTSDNVFSDWLTPLVMLFDKTLQSPRKKSREVNIIFQSFSRHRGQAHKTTPQPFHDVHLPSQESERFCLLLVPIHKVCWKCLKFKSQISDIRIPLCPYIQVCRNNQNVSLYGYEETSRIYQNSRSNIKTYKELFSIFDNPFALMMQWYLCQ